MLVTLPMQRAHQFQVHYRTTQIRRNFERHSELAQSAKGAMDRVAEAASQPLELSWIEPEPEITATPINEPEARTTRPISISRMLARLKLGPSSSGGQDPLVPLA